MRVAEVEVVLVAVVEIAQVVAVVELVLAAVEVVLGLTYASFYQVLIFLIFSAN
ncbi:unnamed protein product [Onchocerca flexuosa]|uniref:Uncharacterized protein n=1 Tax=Onchocerca flexuosa TaxID=387005 RepID=A0A183H837_9BILA|nr:unnamed protein product [Onchocerca flexuosa]